MLDMAPERRVVAGCLPRPSGIVDGRPECLPPSSGEVGIGGSVGRLDAEQGRGVTGLRSFRPDLDPGHGADDLIQGAPVLRTAGRVPEGSGEVEAVLGAGHGDVRRSPLLRVVTVPQELLP